MPAPPVEAPVSVARSTHGPFERISLSAPGEYLGKPLPAQVSVYRVGDLLIDTGGTRVDGGLVAALASRPPRGILLTHQHEDHAGGVPALRRAFGHLPVLAPRALLDAITGGLSVPAYRRDFWGSSTPLGDVEPFDPGHVVEEAGVRLEAVATPGHTPGHVAWIGRARGGPAYALTGDLFISARPVSAWYESAADDMARSDRALAAIADLVLLPTHGRVRDDGSATLGAAADWLESEGDAIRALSERLGTHDPFAIARERYPSYHAEALARATGGEISAAAFVRSVLSPVRALPAAPVLPPSLPG